LFVQLREECAPSHDNLQRVFCGQSMPDHRVFNEMLLQYQVLSHDALPEYACRQSVVLPGGCPACYLSEFKHMQVDACFKFFNQVCVAGAYGRLWFGCLPVFISCVFMWLFGLPPVFLVCSYIRICKRHHNMDRCARMTLS
jgi:hypothetical protein